MPRLFVVMTRALIALRRIVVCSCTNPFSMKGNRSPLRVEGLMILMSLPGLVDLHSLWVYLTWLACPSAGVTAQRRRSVVP